MLAGLVWLSQIPFFFLRSDAVGGELLAEALDTVSGVPREVAQTPPASTTVGQEVGSGADSTTSPLGVLHIPALELTAPIVEGTEEEQISVAVGHLTGSAKLGTAGTALLAAHNATWFRHLDRLQRGDTVRVSTAEGTFSYEVTAARVVHVRDGVFALNETGLVLESCYPLDALRATDYRYLVYATAKKPGA